MTLSQLEEPLLLLGAEKFMGVDIRVRVKGGGHVSQVYAIRQAISKSLVAYYQKCKFLMPELTKTGGGRIFMSLLHYH